MCGRFALTLPHDAMAQLFEAVPSNDLPATPNFNVCPTDQVFGVLQESGTRKLTALRWGFVPSWYKTPNDGPLLINARAETLAQKRAFARACRERRCLIPASGFYEWTKDAQGARLPWYLHPAREPVFAFAGVWQDWAAPDGSGETMRTCAIVTTAAHGPISAIHHRMPVILAAPDWPLWLGEAGQGAAVLMRAAPVDAVVFHRVDPAVNSNRASGPDLIVPLAA